MDITIKSNKLAKVLNEGARLQKEYGARAATVVKNRLAVLKESPTLADVARTPPERCHALTGDYRGCFAVVVVDGLRLVFEPNHDPLPRLESGGPDLKKITRIKILEIVDYH